MDSLYLEISDINNLRNAWRAVREKDSNGGIDGETIQTFAERSEEEISSLSEELLTGRFVPQPYMEVQIPKDNGETRSLGLMCIRDKVVQQAVRDILEPILERMFLDVSYAYRKGRGTGRAIGRVTHLITNEKREWLTSCDIDGFFDNINHDRLMSSLGKRIIAPDFLGLIRTWLKMGKVSNSLAWKDSRQGIPQGGIISPLLSNLYLTPLDHFCVSKKMGFVRYADDFVILSKSKEEAEQVLREVTAFLRDKLKLGLNEGSKVAHINDGFQFLGITFKGHERLVSDEKLESLKNKVRRAVTRDRMQSAKAIKETLQGIHNHYARIIPQSALEAIDLALVGALKKEVKKGYEAGTIKTKQDIEDILKQVEFTSNTYCINKTREIREILAACSRRGKCEGGKQAATPRPVKNPVAKRKHEYRKMEAEGFELIVSTPGSFVGKTQKGVVIKVQGKVVHEAPLNNLKHIFITTFGVSLSSNAVHYAVRQKIPIDFVEFSGRPYARLSHFQSPNVPLQIAQLEAQKDGRASVIAKAIVHGKIKNQMNLTKYYHKYRKSVDEGFVVIYNDKLARMESTAAEIKRLDEPDHEILRGKLFSIEGRSAAAYWDIVKPLLDEVIVFEGRVGQGAQDLVNSLLNYGYAMLSSKIWNAVLRAGLNPFVSFLHKPQAGKPTLLFDLMEEFRPQAVDRVVFSMINKKVELKMDGKLLCPKTRNRLAQGVLERLNTVENFRGRELRLGDIIREQSRALADYLSGESARYAPYIGKW